MGQIFDTWLGLATLGVVLFFVFERPEKTNKILGASADVGVGFIQNLEGRPSSAGSGGYVGI
jgi:hypothetical protein